MEIEIGGSKYRISCGEDQEEHLQVLASLLGRHVSNFSNQYGSIGNAKLLVLAGLTIADQLYDATGQIEELKEELNSAVVREDEIKKKFKKDENEIAAKLDDASAKIEELLKLLMNNPFESDDELPTLDIGRDLNRDNELSYNSSRSAHFSPKNASDQLEEVNEKAHNDADEMASESSGELGNRASGRAEGEDEYNDDSNFIPIDDDEADESLEEQEIKIKFGNQSRNKMWK